MTDLLNAARVPEANQRTARFGRHALRSAPAASPRSDARCAAARSRPSDAGFPTSAPRTACTVDDAELARDPAGIILRERVVFLMANASPACTGCRSIDPEDRVSSVLRVCLEMAL